MTSLGATGVGRSASRSGSRATHEAADASSPKASIPNAVDWTIRPQTKRREGSRIARAIAPFMVRGLEGCAAAYDYPLLPLSDQTRIDGAATRAFAAMRLVTEAMLDAGKRVAWEKYGVIIDSEEVHAIYDAMLAASAGEAGTAETENTGSVHEHATREAGDAHNG